MTAVLAAGPALAQQPPAPTAPVSTAMLPYGPPITLDQAKRAMAAAELEAMKNSWQVAITILDSGGNLVMFHKIDNTQLSAVDGVRGQGAHRAANSSGRARRSTTPSPPAAPACGFWR